MLARSITRNARYFAGLTNDPLIMRQAGLAVTFPMMLFGLFASRIIEQVPPIRESRQLAARCRLLPLPSISTLDTIRAILSAIIRGELSQHARA